MTVMGVGGVLDKRDALDLMHGRGRMTTDPRIPIMPGRRGEEVQQQGHEQ